MEIKTSTRYIHIAPRKLRILRAAIKRMHPVVATKRLALMQDRAAKFFRKSILAALDSAKQRQLEVQTLAFKEVRVDEGPGFKRFRAGSKGSAKRYVRKTSHITIMLTVAPSKGEAKTKGSEITVVPRVEQKVEKSVTGEKPIKIAKAVSKISKSKTK
ncbi:MAG: 50S ribosomal protein L22 [Microgenomates bacterium OLB22]|nr:MAG: 50S ribosomal protein L22 [Microgenomates bacterium OLB22]